MGAVTEVTDATFEQEVLKSESPVLVDFWAPGCPPCAAIAPVLEKLAGEMSGKAKFVKVNAAQERTTAAKYGIQSVPTLFIFKGGEVTGSLIGFQAEDEIRKRLATVVGNS
ncbi:MAG: thioredoxin [Actinobacteria bacterium RBG_13_63_9]|nr:MAG: thioredoxin [Actinobacteria bacterium RBG_13_63_9]